MPHPSPATTASPPSPPPGKKPRGNPTLHLVPRCGARTRAGCPCKSPAVHEKLRCRMHGGRSTGPRTPKGLADLRAARTIHGKYSAETRSERRHRLTFLRQVRITVAATRYQHHLPPVFLARLYGHPPELLPPPRPTGGITAAQDRMRRRAVAAAFAPWKQAIAAAREAHRAARAAKRAARVAARVAKPLAPVRPRPPKSARVPKPLAPIPGLADLADLVAAIRAIRANRPPEPPAPVAPPNVPQPRHPTPSGPTGKNPNFTAVPKPLAPDRAPAPNHTGVPKPLAPIPSLADLVAAIRATRPPEAQAAAAPPHVPPPRHPTPPRPGQTPNATAVPKPLAPERAPTPNHTAVPKPLAPIPGPAEPTIPPDLPNRAARRRWLRQQRRKPGARALPKTSD